MISRESFEALYLGGNKQAMRRNERGVYVLPSIQDAWAGWSAANERIMALEALEQQRVESLSAAYVTIAKVSEQLTAERAISDKLEKTLNDIIVWVDDSWVKGSAIKDSAYTALAEVAAIRAKEKA